MRLAAVEVSDNDIGEMLCAQLILIKLVRHKKSEVDLPSKTIKPRKAIRSKLVKAYNSAMRSHKESLKVRLFFEDLKV